MSSAAPLPHRRDSGGSGDDAQHGGSMGGSARGVGPDVAEAVGPGRPEADEDPTGVRALLASLPDPGPMPPTLVRRIADSLAAEQARSAGVSHQHTAGAQPGAIHGLTSTPPPFHPRRTAARFSRPASSASRPRWQRPVLAVAGAAAAAAVVGSLGVNLVHGPSSSPGAASSAANLNSGPPPKTAASRQSRAAAGAAAAQSAAGSAGIRLGASATAYTAVNLADRSRRLLAAPSFAMSSPATSPAASAGAVATADGARNCLQALGIPAAHRVVVDVATYEGRPAAVLVVAGARDGGNGDGGGGGGGGGGTAYVVRRSCRTGHPGVLHPPVKLR